MLSFSSVGDAPSDERGSFGLAMFRFRTGKYVPQSIVGASPLRASAPSFLSRLYRWLAPLVGALLLVSCACANGFDLTADFDAVNMPFFDGEVAVGASELVVSIAEDSFTATLSFGTVRLPAPFPPSLELAPLRADCPSLTVDDAGMHCRQVSFWRGRRQVGKGAVSMLADGVKVEVTRLSLPFGGGTIRLAGTRKPNGAVSARLAFVGVEAQTLLAGSPAPDVDSIAARIDGQVRVNTGRSSTRLTWDLSIGEAAFSTEDGAYAIEGVDLTWTGQWNDKPGENALGSALAVKNGEGVAGGAYVDFSANPISLKLNATALDVVGNYDFTLEVVHQGVGEAAAKGIAVWDEAFRIRAANGSFRNLQLGQLYTSFLQGALAAGALGNITIGGTAEGDFAWMRGQLERFRTTLENVDVQDEEERFGFAGLSGDIRWDAKDSASALTSVAWSAASALGFTLGPGVVSGYLFGDEFTLANPVSFPLLDGSLSLNNLAVEGIGSPKLAWRLDAQLAPVSMEAVSAAFGWPSFGGTVSGEFPGVRYESSQLVLDNALEVWVLDGLVRVDDLVLEAPFGLVPKLRANATINRLSLEALTRAFSFGEMTGRIDGTVRNLELVDWAVTTFDAQVNSSPEDDIPHRISQRAVDNLASLGGGPTALLSGTFLRFFETFSYRDLGLSCRLRNGVCEMGGIADDAPGYFIVRGSGIPQINVKGFNRRVGWAELLDRIQAAANSRGPVIE